MIADVQTAPSLSLLMSAASPCCVASSAQISSTETDPFREASIDKIRCRKNGSQVFVRQTPSNLVFCCFFTKLYTHLLRKPVCMQQEQRNASLSRALVDTSLAIISRHAAPKDSILLSVRREIPVPNVSCLEGDNLIRHLLDQLLPLLLAKHTRPRMNRIDERSGQQWHEGCYARISRRDDVY